MVDDNSTSPSFSGLHIDVVLAWPDQIWSKSLHLPAGATVGQALAASAVAAEFPEVLADQPAVGVYGVACTLDRVLADNDRVEVYRPLHFDPKESRRRREEHKRAQKRAGKLAAGRLRKAARRQATPLD